MKRENFERAVEIDNELSRLKQLIADKAALYRSLSNKECDVPPLEISTWGDFVYYVMCFYRPELQRLLDMQVEDLKANIKDLEEEWEKL
jgi:hypothetical protein